MLLELNANDLGIFVDESGEQGTESKYYLMALVFRDQSKDISLRLTRYEQSLADAQLPNIPLHALPLMNGHDDYKHLDLVEYLTCWGPGLLRLGAIMSFGGYCVSRPGLLRLGAVVG